MDVITKNGGYLPPPMWPFLEDGLDRPKNHYGRYGLSTSFYSISISTAGADGLMEPEHAPEDFLCCSLGGGGINFSLPRVGCCLVIVETPYSPPNPEKIKVTQK